MDLVIAVSQFLSVNGLVMAVSLFLSVNGLVIAVSKHMFISWIWSRPCRYFSSGKGSGSYFCQLMDLITTVSILLFSYFDRMTNLVTAVCILLSGDRCGHDCVHNSVSWRMLSCPNHTSAIWRNSHDKTRFSLILFLYFARQAQRKCGCLRVV